MSQPIHSDNPRPGFYKMRWQRDGKWLPVAIWRQDSSLVCRVGDKMEPVEKIWTWCADKPVSKEVARFAFDEGYFPDEPKPIPLSNLPADPFEALKIEIEAQRSRAEEWLKAHPTVATQQEADLAANMRSELIRLGKEADALHKAEKAPWLEKAKATDNRYRFRADATAMAEKLRTAFGLFMAREEFRQKQEAAARFKAEQAAVAAERARIEAEAKEKLARDPIAALTEDAPVLPELPLAPEPVKLQAGGGIGRRAGLKSVWGAIIDDHRAALIHFEDHPDLRRELERLVTHAIRDSKGTLKIPGVRATEARVPA